METRFTTMGGSKLNAAAELRKIPKVAFQQWQD
jgi:hypothetical protein